MMGVLLLLFSCFLALSFQPAYAIDAGVVEGSFTLNDEAIPLRHAYSQLHDNKEGLLDTPKELRILLCDRQVSQDSLAGIVFLPVMKMAREGQVRGLLLRFDPNSPQSVIVTILSRPANPQQSLPSQTLSATGEKVIEGWRMSPTRVSGTIKHEDKEQSQFSEIPKINYSLRFSAPLFHEPAITADLKGKQARESPQAGVCRDKARALTNGDWDALKRLSSEQSGRKIDLMLAQMGKDAHSLLKPLAGEMEQAVKQVQRVVVRGNRAVMILPDKQWLNFVREDGVWKSDD